MKAINKKNLFIFLFFFIFQIGLGSAQWSQDPKVNIPICTDSSRQSEPIITSDGFGGAIIAWFESNKWGWSQLIYTSRITLKGQVLWQPGGLLVSYGECDAHQPVIINDDSNGYFFAWEECNSIFIQKVNIMGEFALPDWWRVHDNEVNSDNPKIIRDGTGGAIIAWNVGSYDYDIYTQRINTAGDTLWGKFGSLVLSKYSAEIVRGSFSGVSFIIVWLMTGAATSSPKKPSPSTRWA